jgi:hypothetical protein
MLLAISFRSASWLDESVVFDEVSSATRSLSALVISASVIEPPALANDVKSALRTGSLRLEIQEGALEGGREDAIVAVVAADVAEVDPPRPRAKNALLL